MNPINIVIRIVVEDVIKGGLKTFFRGLTNSTTRQASEMCKHVQKLMNAQSDIASPQAREAIATAVRDTEAAIQTGSEKAALEKQMGKLEETAAKWIKPYPHAELRENIEVFLVAIVVAMAIRTFFLQPFKIPTGSMEPTLFGIETTDLRDDSHFQMPNPLVRAWNVIYDGIIYHEIIAPEDGEVVQIAPLQHTFGVFNKQTFWVLYRGHSQPTPITIWCGPDDYFRQRTGVDVGLTFTKGQPIIRFKEITGDHLFVDRLTYNFRHPHRGDIIVFKTKGIEGIPDQSLFYIKRLVGLPGETVSIGEDQHARINGVRLDASTSHFENVYGFDPTAPRRQGSTGHYNGHILIPQDSRCLLRSPNDSIEVPPHRFLVFGDNTMNSADSRYWGTLPEENVIGKSFFVYWPISSRFGWGQR